MSKKGVTKNNLNVKTSAELLSYIINQDPTLSENIPLPKQGQDIKTIGKLIMDNQRYKNAFLNVCNIIGLTVITRNHWENPWKKFTDKGRMSYGQQVREIITDIANIYDYNQYVEHPEEFLKTVVPNVLQYIHSINYQKFYKTSTSDEQMAMAFETGDLFSLIDDIVNSLFEGDEYDTYLVNKYMLARRILDGTVTAIQITDMATKTDREVVADIKGYSNDMTFRSPNFNPAGIRKATSFEDQFAIVSTKFDAKFTTNVLATSYFRSDAEMKAQLELCDGFGNFDDNRLAEIFAKRDDNLNIIPNEYVDGYVPLTDDEKAALNKIPVVLLGVDFFQDRYYGLDNATEGGSARKTEFFNPMTLRTNHFLHRWGVVSTSPFENAIVFTSDAQAVSSVTVSPSTANVSAGQTLKLSATVVTTGFANKSVAWSVDSTSATAGVTIDSTGLLYVPSTVTSGEITVTATSIYDDSVSGTATITVGDGQTSAITSVTVSPATATVSAGGSLYLSASVIAQGEATTEVEWSVDSAAATDGVTISNAGLLEIPAEPTVESITVTATSTYDETKSDTATITVGS